MTPSVISEDKIRAYAKTHYRVGTGARAFHLRIGKLSPAMQALYKASGRSTAVFITAYNPFGGAQSEEANEAAHALLVADIRDLASSVIEGSGVDPDSDWPPEKSVLALGVGLDEARGLGDRFRQDAIVWIGSDAVPQLIFLR